MNKNCLSCRNAFHFCNGMCKCFIESPDGNTHYDDFSCENHEFITEDAYEERLLWKRRQEQEEQISKM